ncbi:MAG: hypothetical protein IIB08_09630 [Bacteroidetes bacterium]|nr:hypothetical protein [Bacteroidota bacterium]
MSLIEEILLNKLKQLGLQEGSGSFADYERAKALVKNIASNPTEHDQLIRKVTDYLRCQL